MNSENFLSLVEARQSDRGYENRPVETEKLSSLRMQRATMALYSDH